MSLIEAFFTQTATIQPFIREGSGEPVYGPSEERRCRMERGKFLTTVNRYFAGTVDQAPAHAKMFCTGEAIPERSLVRCDGQEFVVINCEVMRGFADNHLEVYLQ